MTEQEFLALAQTKYREINALKESPNLLDYEVGFRDIWTKLGLEVAQANLGKQGKDTRKKKDKNNIRQIRIIKDPSLYIRDES